MDPETVEKILAEIDERIAFVEGKSGTAESDGNEYHVAHFNGQAFGLAFVREMIEAHRRGEKERNTK